MRREAMEGLREMVERGGDEAGREDEEDHTSYMAPL